MRKGKDPEPDPDPYLSIMDPDPGGPKHADQDPQHWILVVNPIKAIARAPPSPPPSVVEP